MSSTMPTVADTPDMEPIKLGYSFKNISMSHNETMYNCKLYEMAARFINRVRYKVHWSRAENEKENEPDNNNYNVFRSRTTAEPLDDLKSFEEEFYQLIGSIEFRKSNNNLSKKMKNDIEQIRNCNRVIMFADKSSNLYKIEKEKYEKMLLENITKEYRLAPENLIEEINNEAQEIIMTHCIKGKIPKYDLQEAFITVKDHKVNFPNKIQCRLINPSKTHIAKISKSILDNINSSIRSESVLKQWRNTGDVLCWFNEITDKRNKHFVKFDIEGFYPNISRNTLMKAITFAKKFVDILDSDVDIILHSCKTVLQYNNNVWVKKNNHDNFDVPMGSFHGAELCELIGLYMLEKLKGVFDEGNYGIYRDDGLAVVHKCTPGQQERLVKNMRSIFKKQGFNITIEKELKQTEFLDVVLDLNNEIHRPYKKPNTELSYISNLSNHPKYIRDHIPNIISQRLSKLSSNKTTFDSAKDEYRQALSKSKYKPDIKYNESISKSPKKKRQRKRKVIYFQPPYSAAVKTPIGKLFLKLVKKHFHKRSRLYKILSHRTLKLSYSCLPNVKSAISGNNRKLLKGSEDLGALCNCQRSRVCPVAGKCQLKKVVYKAEIVDAEGQKKVYVGSTGNTFKERYTTHKATLKKKDHPKATALSRHFWKKKIEHGKDPTIS